METPGQKFRRLLKDEEYLFTGGVYSPLDAQIAEKVGIPGYLIDGPEDIKREWFDGKQAVGVTAGASAPEVLVTRVVSRLQEWGGEVAVEAPGQQEHVVFSLPRELRTMVRS